MKNRIKKLILLSLYFSSYFSKAQSINIMGRIIDEKTNKALENVVVKSSSATVIGDLDGNFNIDVESRPVYVVEGLQKSQAEISTSSWAQGTYIIRIETDKGVKTSKLIRN